MRTITDRISEVFSSRKPPGLDEICTLLNFEENPAALVETGTWTLTFINSKLMRVSGFSTQDLWKKPVDDLFPEHKFQTSISGEIKTVLMKHRDQSILQTKVRLSYIDHQSHWLVIKLIDDPAPTLEEAYSDSELLPAITQFAQISDLLELPEILLHSLESCLELIETQTAALYQLDASFPQLRKISVAGEEVHFPDLLPSSDLMRLGHPMVWNSANKVLTELHRFARSNNFKYLGSAPLIQGEAAFGLLVSAGDGEIPTRLTPELLKLAAVLTLSHFQHHLLVQNLNTTIVDEREKLAVRDIAFEGMSEGIVLLDMELVIQEVNPAIEWILGYSASEIINQTYENILIGSDRLLPALLEAIKGKVTLNIGKASLNRRNGQSIPVLIKVSPVMIDTQVKAVEVFINDISEHEHSKVVTQQLEHRAVLGDYTAAFAHDIRNPINNISTGLQLLGAVLPEEDSNQDVINRMQGDCTRLNHLMESFLAFSRPMELKYELFNVDLFLKRILDRWQPRMSRVNVKPVLHVEKDVEFIYGDPRSLENVFTNLISNALEAMNDVGDTLVVKATKVEEVNGHPYVEVSISDNGPGIPVDVLDHIFEPFVTTREKGTGLGLAITKQIVTAHKGSIRVNSFPGGTVFIVQLPAQSGV